MPRPSQRVLPALALVAALALAGCTTTLQELGQRANGQEAQTIDGPPTYRFHIAAVGDPTTDEDARRVLQDALAYWSERGFPVQMATGQGQANRLVRFGGAWDGHEVGRSCVTDRTDLVCEVEIGLGDARCNDAWLPFDQATLARITVHEVGHALGMGHRQDPGSPMHATVATSYQAYCERLAGEVEIEPSTWWGLGFRLTAPETVAYTVEALGQGRVEACLLSQTGWSQLASQGPDGWACEQDVRQAEGSADLAPGDYRLAVRCTSAADHGCEASYSLGWA